MSCDDCTCGDKHDLDQGSCLVEGLAEFARGERVSSDWISDDVVELARSVIITDTDGHPIKRIDNARISLGPIQKHGDIITYDLTINDVTDEL